MVLVFLQMDHFIILQRRQVDIFLKCLELWIGDVLEDLFLIETGVNEGVDKMDTHP